MISMIDVLADDRDAKDLVIRIPVRQPNVQLTAADEAAGERREDQSVGVRADMKAVDENDRRAGHVDEQAGKRKSAGDGIGVKLRAHQDLVETLQNGARQQGNFAVGLMAFRKQQPNDDHEQEREGGEDDEYPWPADCRRDQAADRRSEQRRHAQHQHQQRQNFRALARRKEVPHHGNGADLRDAAAKRLQQAKGNEQCRANARRCSRTRRR